MWSDIEHLAGFSDAPLVGNRPKVMKMFEVDDARHGSSRG
ncbi:hypothetical protein IMCC1989_2351 [gamma proteobacterium IMCC1989]|nr:hypothetical protein IMCC1989_2351 [gamma proteobacterium IMCC1989]